MTAETLYFSLWFLATLATIWDIRRTHRSMQASLEHIEQTAQEISSLLAPHPE